MKKKILALVIVLMMVLTTNAFAYRWVESGSDWYVVDEGSGQYLKGMLLDVGDNVYYLDGEGKLAGRKDGRHRYQELQQAANPARTVLPHHCCQTGVG